MNKNHHGKVVAFSGGVGGAKLALGLARVLGADDLTVIVNTGDDFRYLGLAISPDIDTLIYTLSGLSNQELGWGRRDETWTFMSALAQLGGETWFQLGDGDLALHVERTRRLAAGESLSSITDSLRRRLDISTRIIPMSDDPVHTQLRSETGWLNFQDYFVRLRCEPVVQQISFAGAQDAQPAEGILAALGSPDLRAVVICPSNPMLSVEPILAVPGIREAIVACGAPVIAVSPIIGGIAVKGPTAKLMRELNMEPSATAAAWRYAGLVDVFVVDMADAGAAMPEGMMAVAAPIFMQSLEDREQLAQTVLDIADRI
ncbi:MAG: 2-phospho-L-lactate transferase [Georgfuchsia sp.]